MILRREFSSPTRPSIGPSELLRSRKYHRRVVLIGGSCDRKNPRKEAHLWCLQFLNYCGAPNIWVSLVQLLERNCVRARNTRLP